MESINRKQTVGPKELRPEAGTVAAVVVTFNRKVWLVDCLKGLRSQTRPLDRIYVVDNASSDGTKELLQQAGYLDNPLFRYVKLPSNVGGAGGFAAGMKIAYEDGFDWFWLMDDDVEPSPTGVADLLEFREISGCIHGRRTNPNGTPFPWGDQFFEQTVLTKRISDPLFLSHLDFQTMNTGCFEGMLVSKQVISRVGFPNSDFFITWDDTFYGFLASRVTTVLYVNRFVMKRKRDIDNVESQIFGQRILLSPLALFYFHRNRFLVARQLRVLSYPFWKATAWIVVRGLFRELVLARSMARARAIVRGVYSGISWLKQAQKYAV